MSKAVYRHKILVVDHETIHLEMMLNALKDDYTILVATNRIKVLNIANSTAPPDLILLDISMPDIDGYEVCRQIKQSKQCENVPIIFISASLTEEEQLKGLELGAVDYFSKPICLPILKAKIKSHLEMKQHRDFMALLLNKQDVEMEDRNSLHEKNRLEQQLCIQSYIEEVQKNQERLQLSLWGSGDELWDWSLISGEFRRENPLPLKLGNISLFSSIESFEPLIHAEDFNELKGNFFDHLKNEAEFFEAAFRSKNNLDEWVWLLLRGKIVNRDSSNNPTRISGTLKNISHLKQVEQDLLLAAKSFENIFDAVWVCDHNWNILKINTAFTTITGFTVEDVFGKSLLTLMGEQYKEVLQVFSNQLLSNTHNDRYSRDEVWGVDKSGSYFPQELNISVLRDNANVVTHFIGAFTDTTYRKNAEDKLRYLANYDGLTGLPNRTLFMERIQHAIDIAHRNKHQMAVIFLDLDNFKSVNDNLGHTSGDILLKEIGKRLSSAIRDCDTASRLGADEFALLLERINHESEILPIAERILRDIAKPLNLAGSQVSLSASVGITVYPNDSNNYKDLLRHADIAMYQAKSLGRNNIQFYTEEMDHRSLFRMELEQQLHHLVNDDQFLINYQPKIRLSTGKIDGLEALVRWNHPKHGLIPPDMFISLAEETGHIVRLGEAILRKACIESKEWWSTNQISGRLAVNLSAVQIAQENLPLRVACILEETGFKAENLEFEITESSMMENQSLAEKQMLAFQNMGIHLSIDDFGTGYSSLSRIKDLSVNTIKIDRSFIKDIDHSPKDKGIVASIISLAHHLNLKVIAEGVETLEQKAILTELHCDEMQGYIFSRPIANIDINDLLDKQ
jgi:diguanylate cyclase (GGDEF)-like protein/PAS domain S-box-containing protein